MYSDTEEIKSKLNIVDVLKDYIRLDKAGANWKANCPFHNEKTPSFMVSEDKQIWHCFGCGKGGDIFGFIMEIEGLSFPEALKFLAEKAGVQLKMSGRNFSPEKAADKNKILEILELATKFYETQLWKGNGKIKIINYLKGRGLKDETIKEFRLGYAPPGWRNLLTFLTGRNYKIEDIAKTGLLVEKKNEQDSDKIQNSKFKIQNYQYYDRFRDRIMFPIADITGRVVGFSARVAPGGDESQAKYVNTPETEVYHKSRILYGIDKAKAEIRREKFAFLVEGNLDVIAASQAGIKNAVAVSGTALTIEQIGIIKRYGEKVAMNFDMDSAGEVATKKSIGLCLEKDLGVEIVTLPEGKDAAELAQKDPEKLKAAMKDARPALDYFFRKTLEKHNRTTAAGQRKISEEILEMVRKLASAIEQGHWIKKLAETLDIKETLLTDMLRKARIKESTSAESETSGRENSFAGSKKEILLKDLLGLIATNDRVWKEFIAKKEKGEINFRDQLINILAEKGPAAGYDFGKLISLVQDPETAADLERAYFEKKYRLGLNNEPEEIIIEEPLIEMGKIIRAINIESRREELAKITQDLKRAEASKDKEAAVYLRGQFKKISEEALQ